MVEEKYYQEINKLRRYVFILLGLLSFSLGTIGIVLPVLPTVPFYLLTSYFFARGSKKFEYWFKNSTIYNKYLKDFQEKRTMTINRILLLMIFSSSVLIHGIYMVDNQYVKTFLLITMIYKYYYFYNNVKVVSSIRGDSNE